jgi:hypothetical protein
MASMAGSYAMEAPPLGGGLLAGDSLVQVVPFQVHVSSRGVTIGYR